MGVLDFLQGRKPKKVEDDQIDPGELQDAGIEIQKGDSRLKGGISRSNLSELEREKLDNMRKKKNAGLSEK